MASLNILEAQRYHPRLFDVLRAAGWSEDRHIAVSDEFYDDAAGLGFFADDYQREFLQSFHGLEVHFEFQVPSGTEHRSLTVGFGEQLERMNARVNIGYIRRLAKTPELIPIIMSGDLAVFGIDDGRCLALEVSFRYCVWSANPFEMMEWLLFGTWGRGIVFHELTMEERSPLFR